ncbi:hypothetical protein HY970_02565 [Candidatus Kaiserbacteria bacterium]|nr:hypothetical protein [Candidatus Kaiserbacteria bacterium]
MTAGQAAPQGQQLFHTDNENYFDYERLRKKARDVVARSSLINRCKQGDLHAATALHRGFYAYVADFQAAIDQRAGSHGLKRQPLYDKFTRRGTMQIIVNQARTLKLLQQSELDAIFDAAERELMHMQQEERTHWHHWVHDAMALGLSRDVLVQSEIVPGVARLIDAARSENMLEFFAGSLAATEFMAEELGNQLAYNPHYGKLFVECRRPEQRGKPYWMIVHMVPHVDGPSHADIVLDFGRAYDESGAPDAIHLLVERGLELFGEAADQVETHFSPVGGRLAAE